MKFIQKIAYKLSNIIRVDLSKNTKLFYYLTNIFYVIIPKPFFKYKLEMILDKCDRFDYNYILGRVDYYNKIVDKSNIESRYISIKNFKKTSKTTYFFDLYYFLRYYDDNFKFSYVFGDVIDIPEYPSFVKSRPISDINQNSIILKLNKIRHFVFIQDKINFIDKKDMLIWRGKIHKEKRISFFNTFFGHPKCDIGITNSNLNKFPQWRKGRMSIEKQLEYKFILSIEGNDVATNLKWAMSSNSLVMMKKPEYETWFMEGKLIPNYHYVLLADEYSDLEEKIEYYSKHVDEALEIVKNANKYVEQFLNPIQEELISLLVLEKYFYSSNQIEAQNILDYLKNKRFIK